MKGRTVLVTECRIPYLRKAVALGHAASQEQDFEDLSTSLLRIVSVLLSVTTFFLFTKIYSDIGKQLGPQSN